MYIWASHFIHFVGVWLKSGYVDRCCSFSCFVQLENLLKNMHLAVMWVYTASDAALAACWTAHQLQVGRADVEDSSPQYLSQHISLCTSTHNTRSSSVPLLCVPFRRTSFARRSFSTAVLLLLELTATCCVKLRLALSTLKSRLKTHLFSTAFC